MAEVIHAEHLFDIRRLKADVERAERQDGKGYTPSFHAQFQEVLWGNSRVARPEHLEAQRKLNDYFHNLVFPPKPKEE